MALVLELSDAEEREIVADARREGVTVQDYLRRIVSDRSSKTKARRRRVAPPAEAASAEPTSADDEIQRIQALVLKWQQQDSTPTYPPAPNDGTMTPSEALFHKWDQEYAKLTQEERQAEERVWQEFQEGINSERVAAGMRTIF